MRINDIDISTFSADLIDRQISTHNVKTITDWFAGNNEGIVLRQTNDFKSLLLTFVIKEETEDAAYKQISNLTEELKKCILEFDDINLLFYCYLDGSVTPERLQNSVFKVQFLLKNDWAEGDKVEAEHTFAVKNFNTIDLTFKQNWTGTIGYYTSCFDYDEIYETIAEEKFYFDPDLVNGAIEVSNSWTELFINLGIDINKYKPKEGNTLYGYPGITRVYDKTTAAAYILSLESAVIYYDRFHEDGYIDMPYGEYDGVVWSTGQTNQYFFDTLVGMGEKYEDISIVVTGRYYSYDTSKSNGPIFSADQYFRMDLYNDNSTIYVGNVNPMNITCFKTDTTTGQRIALVTLESIADLPMRTYAFKSSNQGDAANPGYVDIIFNGVSKDRKPITYGTLGQELDDNIILGGYEDDVHSTFVASTYLEICRAKIYSKDKLLADLIPINGSLKNCFYNNYDVGLYDINSMEYIPWKKTDGTYGLSPSKYMPLPGYTPPPPPPVPSRYLATIVSGSGTDYYLEGETVTIVANAPTAGYQWKGWIVNAGTVSLVDASATTTTFTMPKEEVTITATYELIPEPDKWQVTVTDGSGSGLYEAGQTVTITINAAPTGQQFVKWQVDAGGVELSDKYETTTTFTMPQNDVSISVIWEDIPPEPGILIYRSLSDINSETTMGENAVPWADFTSSAFPASPRAFDQDLIVCFTQPYIGVESWQVYNTSYISIDDSWHQDKWGREYITMFITSSKSRTGQYIKANLWTGDTYRQDFCIATV